MDHRYEPRDRFQANQTAAISLITDDNDDAALRSQFICRRRGAIGQRMKRPSSDVRRWCRRAGSGAGNGRPRAVSSRARTPATSSSSAASWASTTTCSSRARISVRTARPIKNWPTQSIVTFFFSLTRTSPFISIVPGFFCCCCLFVCFVLFFFWWLASSFNLARRAWR